MALPPRTVILGSPPSPTHKVDPLELADLLEGMDVNASDAIAAAQAAETAADAAFVNADVYANVSAGLAAVLDGEQFQVVKGTELIRYERLDASTAVEVARLTTNTNGFAAIVQHASSSDFPRPVSGGVVFWMGSAQPSNALLADLWVVPPTESTTVPVAAALFSSTGLPAFIPAGNPTVKYTRTGI